MAKKKQRGGRRRAGAATAGCRAAVIGGRYELRERIGSGGQSEVWSADDRIGGGRVAVKLINCEHGVDPLRVRGEISVLRLHQIPGVVRLLDEGAGEAQPFIVMELISGAPFPGEGRGGLWSALAPTAVALVEALARLHAEGVIHQDLKPQNVLVDARGTPTILDFGIASDRRLEELTDGAYLFGSLPYLAPERLRGQPLTPRSDLYSLGVLLFEALTGVLPHQGTNTREVIHACAFAPAPAVHKLSRDVPATVAGLVDLLLSKDPERRPRSALEVLGVLRGHPGALPSEPPLVKLSDGLAVAALLRLAREGRSGELVGPPRTGRSRCLDEVRSTLDREGRRVVVLRPNQRVFGGVAPIVGALDDLGSERLSRVQEVVDERLRSALGGGLVILAEDVERMDPYSAAALARCRDSGALLRVFEAGAEPPGGDPSRVVRLAPLDTTALTALFGGAERLFHLRSHAAATLHARTGGVQARVDEELREWMRAGVVAWDGSSFLVTRDLLDRLELRAPVSSLAVTPMSASGPGLSRGLEDLLAWLSLTWPDGTSDLLSPCMAQPIWQVEAQLEELVRLGAARLRPDGVFEPLVTPGDHAWSAERRRVSHETVAAALPPAAPRRFAHMVIGLRSSPSDAEITALVEEAVTLAHRLAAEGSLKRATAALEVALAHLRRPLTAPGPQGVLAEERLLAALLDLALADSTAPIVGKVQYEIGRARTKTDLVVKLDRLVQAALAYTAGGDRALRLLDAIPPFEGLNLERRRQGLRALASRRCAPEVEDAVIANISAWAAPIEDATTHARLAFWVGWWHYRRGRFSDAAASHAQAAQEDPWRLGRISARIACASALLETFDLEQASHHAEGALHEARHSGSPYIEARAEWIRRAVLYRRGAAGAPDLDLVEAVAQLHARDIEAAVCFTEAAIARRAGLDDVARGLAERASSLWKFVHDPWPNLLARSLALAMGGKAESPGEIAQLGRRARACPVRGLGIQALGMLAQARGAAPLAWRRAAIDLLAGIPRDHFGVRMDLLSVNEALEALAVRPAGA